MSKTYSDTYFYREYNQYDKKLLDFILNAQRIDTRSDLFADIVYDVKRRKVSDSLVKILQSPNTILGINPSGEPLPKAFKVFVAKDVKNDKKSKVFIDVTGLVRNPNGTYICDKVEWLIAYLINAMVSFIYATPSVENKITGNASICKDGGAAFVALFSAVLDRLYKISTVRELRLKIEYIIAVYWQINILGKDQTKSMDSIKGVAINMVGIEPRWAEITSAAFKPEDFKDIKSFIMALQANFRLEGLNIAVFADRWMQSYGVGTIFGTEFFPAFSQIMTNAYVGGYIDNQATIEKATGQHMVAFTKDILVMGATVV